MSEKKMGGYSISPEHIPALRAFLERENRKRQMSEHKHRWYTRYIEIKGVSCASGLECRRCGAVLDSDAVEAIINEIMDRPDSPMSLAEKLERQMNDDNVYAGGKVVEWMRKKSLPTGWLCPRCGKVNAPDVKRCDCKPSRLPHTVVGPTETKLDKTG